MPMEDIKKFVSKVRDFFDSYSEDILSVIQFTKIWMLPIFYFLIRFVVLSWGDWTDKGDSLTVWGSIYIIGISLIPIGVFTALDTYQYFFYHERDFSLKRLIKRTFKLDPMEMSREKKIAMYPSVPGRYLSRKPNGFILGKYKGKYVRFRLDKKDIMMGIIIGAPGVGKTAAIYLLTLIANYMKETSEQMVAYVLDIKPEIAAKSVEIYENPNVRVMNPTNRNSWGWDVYYELKDGASDSEVIKVLNDIASALIVSDNPKDKFFTTSATRVFTGMMLYYYKKDFCFIDSVIEIISQPMDAHLKKILSDKKFATKNSKVVSLLSSYVGKDSDAVTDIELSLQENLAVFLYDDVRYMLRDNPLKACPEDLNNGISLFNSFPEELLNDASYPTLFRLMSTQVLHAMQKRSPSSQPCALILDECARIGKLPSLTDCLATCRSRKVSIWMAFQSPSQIEEVYGKETARSIQNLCRIKAILECADNPSQKVFSEMAGQYREVKTTVSEGEHGSKTSKTYEWRKILEPADLMSLDEKEEIVLFIKGRYMRIDKHYYFEDSVLNDRYLQLIDINGYEE